MEVTLWKKNFVLWWLQYSVHILLSPFSTPSSPSALAQQWPEWCGTRGPVGSSGTPLSCETGCWAYMGFWTIQQSSSLWGLGINDILHPRTPHCCRIYSESPLSLESAGGEFSPLIVWEELDCQSVARGGSGPLPHRLLSGLADPHAFMYLSYYSCWVRNRAERLLCTTQCAESFWGMISMTVKVSAMKGLFWWRRREGNGRHPPSCTVTWNGFSSPQPACWDLAPSSFSFLWLDLLEWILLFGN